MIAHLMGLLVIDNYNGMALYPLPICLCGCETIYLKLMAQIKTNRHSNDCLALIFIFEYELDLNQVLLIN